METQPIGNIGPQEYVQPQRANDGEIEKIHNIKPGKVQTELASTELTSVALPMENKTSQILAVSTGKPNLSRVEHHIDQLKAAEQGASAIVAAILLSR